VKLPAFVPKDLRQLARFVPTSGWDAIEWTPLVGAMREVSTRYVTGRGVASLRDGLSEAVPDITWVKKLRGVERLDRVREPEALQAAGNAILQLYFAQWLNDDGLFIDLRAVRFGLDDQAVHYAPNGLWIRLRPEFREGMVALYRSFYSDDEKAFDSALKQIERNFGKGAIMRLGSEEARIQIPAVSTGSLGLDLATGVGGVPRGRVTEIYGPESSGKTTLALHCIAEAQKTGGVAAFVDAEHALDVAYARRLGVNVDDLLVSQPDTGEQALDIAEILVRSGAVDILVVDSVAALVPRAELEGEMGDTHVGLQARLMSQAMRKLASVISKSRAAVIFINQIRMKIGVMFGSPETTTGGNALKFYASVRLDIRRIGKLKTGEEEVGNRTRVKVVKNKVAPPFRMAEFDILFGTGINRTGELIDMGVAADIVSKSGAWYSYGDERLGQGRDNACNYLKEHSEIAQEVEERLKAKHGLGSPDATDLPAEDAEEE